MKAIEWIKLYGSADNAINYLSGLVEDYKTKLDFYTRSAPVTATCGSVNKTIKRAGFTTAKRNALIAKTIGKLPRNSQVLVKDNIVYIGITNHFIKFESNENVSNGNYSLERYKKLKTFDPVHVNNVFMFNDDYSGWDSIEITDELRKVFDFCTRHASDDETRYYMSGIYVDSENCVATNGHTLGYTPLSIELSDKIKALHKCNIAIPINNIQNAASNLLINPTKKSLCWIIDDIEYIQPTIDGQFPMYTRVIPEYTMPSCNISFDLPTREDIKMIIAKAKIDKEAPIWHSPDQAVQFSASYLLNLIDSNITTLYGVDRHKAFIGKNGNNNAIIMPMKTPE